MSKQQAPKQSKQQAAKCRCRVDSHRLGLREHLSQNVHGRFWIGDCKDLAHCAR